MTLQQVENKIMEAVCCSSLWNYGNFDCEVSPFLSEGDSLEDGGIDFLVEFFSNNDKKAPEPLKIFDFEICVRLADGGDLEYRVGDWMDFADDFFSGISDFVSVYAAISIGRLEEPALNLECDGEEGLFYPLFFEPYDENESDKK